MKITVLLLCLFFAVSVHAETVSEIHEIPSMLSVNISDLSPGEYCLRLSAVDNAGNESLQSEEICVTLQPQTVIFFSPKLFTDTAISSKRYKTFTIYNRGNVDLVCSQPQFTGRNAADFSTNFTGDFRSVPPGQSIPFRVYFTPSGKGERMASVTVKCNNYDEPLVVTLTGKGI